MDNYLPNVTCPYCKKSFIISISGFGRTGYNARTKECRYCRNEFIVELIVNVTKESIPDDMKIAHYIRSIKALRRIRKERAKKLQEEWKALGN